MAERNPARKAYWKRRNGSYARNVKALTLVNKDQDLKEMSEILEITEEIGKLQERVLTKKSKILLQKPAYTAYKRCVEHKKYLKQN